MGKIIMKAEPVNLSIYNVEHRIICSKCGVVISRTMHPSGYSVLICGCSKPIKEDTCTLLDSWNVERMYRSID